MIEKVLDCCWYDLRDKCQGLNMSNYELLLMYVRIFAKGPLIS